MKEPVLVLLDLRRGGAIPLLRHRPRALELLVLLDLRRGWRREVCARYLETLIEAREGADQANHF